VNILSSYLISTRGEGDGQVSRGELVQMLSLDPANIKVSSMKMF
jgi:hypothetical protein